MQGIQYKISEKFQEIKIINIFDVEKELSVNSHPFLILNTFTGLGQLNFNNFLYFCGGNDKIKGGTYFLMYDSSKIMNSLTHMINCLFDHKYPSMIQFKNEFIIVVGGMEKNLKSEIYSLTKGKWKALPDLPENRYGSSLLNEEKLDYIYLFGGLSDDYYCSSILRLNMKSLISWESVIVNENSYLLQKSHFAVIRSDKNKILLLGGSNKGSELNDSVVEFDMISKNVKLSSIKLLKPSKFNVTNYVESRKTLFYFFDHQSFIHIFNKVTSTFRCTNYKDNFNDDDDDN